jgi:hypothetical protein
MRRGDRIALVAVVLAGCAVSAAAQPAACSRTDFESAVGDAAQTLVALNQKNAAPFQAKLRQLKDKRGWSHDQFMKEAQPLVQDEKIAEFDRQSGEFLDRINSMSDAGTTSRVPDCKLLAELRANMKAMVDAQVAKWAYMFERVDKEIAR